MSAKMAGYCPIDPNDNTNGQTKGMRKWVQMRQFPARKERKVTCVEIGYANRWVVKVRFFKKMQDWILKSERIRKWILRFFTRQINPRSFGSGCVKGTEESSLEVEEVDTSFNTVMADGPVSTALIIVPWRTQLSNCFRLTRWP